MCLKFHHKWTGLHGFRLHLSNTHAKCYQLWQYVPFFWLRFMSCFHKMRLKFHTFKIIMIHVSISGVWIQCVCVFKRFSAISEAEFLFSFVLSLYLSTILTRNLRFRLIRQDSNGKKCFGWSAAVVLNHSISIPCLIPSPSLSLLLLCFYQHQNKCCIHF